MFSLCLSSLLFFLLFSFFSLLFIPFRKAIARHTPHAIIHIRYSHHFLDNIKQTAASAIHQNKHNQSFARFHFPVSTLIIKLALEFHDKLDFFFRPPSASGRQHPSGRHKCPLFWPLPSGRESQGWSRMIHKAPLTPRVLPRRRESPSPTRASSCPAVALRYSSRHPLIGHRRLRCESAQTTPATATLPSRYTQVPFTETRPCVSSGVGTTHSLNLHKHHLHW